MEFITIFQTIPQCLILSPYILLVSFPISLTSNQLQPYLDNSPFACLVDVRVVVFLELLLFENETLTRGWKHLILDNRIVWNQYNLAESLKLIGISQNPSKKELILGNKLPRKKQLILGCRIFRNHWNQQNLGILEEAVSLFP